MRSVRRRYRRSSGAASFRLLAVHLGGGRSIPVGMLLFIVLGIGGFFATETGFSQTAEVAGHACVRDGDTLVVGGTPVRLKGLHCPELSEAGGAQASSVISRMVAGQQVSCKLTGERTYDRVVGRC